MQINRLRVVAFGMMIVGTSTLYANNALVTQEAGSGNQVTITQSNLFDSSASVLQLDDSSFNQAAIQQSNGDNLIASITQSLGQLDSLASITQTGSGSLATISQSGASASQASIEQSGGEGNRADILQSDLDLSGSSDFSTATILQQGDLNSATISQIGSAYSQAGITQRGDANTAQISQSAGNNLLASIEQQGNGNTASISQTGEWLEASILQQANQATAHITQDAIGAAGNPNRVEISQLSDGAYAQVSQSTSGGGNTVIIHQ